MSKYTKWMLIACFTAALFLLSVFAHGVSQEVEPPQTPIVVTATITPTWTLWATNIVRPTRTLIPTSTFLPVVTNTSTLEPTPTVAPTKTPLPEYPTMKGVGDTYDTYNWHAAGLGNWGYDWSATPPRIGSAEMVPMIYSRKQLGSYIGGNSMWLMAYNEPGVPAQANVTPRQAAIDWPRFEAYGKRLTTPCVGRVTWIREWMNEHRSIYGGDPEFDAICVHPYPFTGRGLESVAHSIAESKKLTMEAILLAEELDKQVWVAEFATLPSYGGIGQDGLIEYMQKMIKFYRQQRRVTRYAWFQVRYRCTEQWSFGPENCTTLVDYSTNQLTALGQVYKEQ